MAWKPDKIERASSSAGTAASTVAIITASALVKLSGSAIISRARRREVGTLPGAPSGPRSLRPQRVVHSPMMRRLPVNSATRRRRRSTAPLRKPAAHSASSWGRCASKLLWCARNTSSVRARSTLRTSLRLWPVVGTICLIGMPSRQHQNCLCGRHSLTVAFVLQAFSAGQPAIDRGGAQRDADGGHRLAHGSEEGGAGVLHQVPAVGDLKLAYGSVRVAASP